MATGKGEQAAEYRIDELAREAGTTVRNVRAYQERGLLPPTQKRGRVVIYTDEHLARLRQILALLARGYTLASIGELLRAWTSGQKLGEVLGLEEALTSPWSDEEPEYVQMEELRQLFKQALTPEQLAAAVRLGVLKLDQGGARVLSPRLLEAGAAITSMGVPLDAVLEEMEALRGHTEAIATGFVELAVEHLFAPGLREPPPQQLQRLAQDTWRLRQIAREVTQVALARALERQVQQKIAALAPHLSPLVSRDGEDPA